MTAKGRVLLVEDTPSILRLYHEFVEDNYISIRESFHWL